MKFLSIGLSFLTVFQLALPAQQQTPPKELNIVVVEGEGVINKVGERVARPPVVRVEDEDHRPITGAAVVFTLPTEGATGEFGNGSKNFMVMTDAQGQAAAQGLKMNRVPGKVPIHINASFRGVTARTNLTEFSEAGPGAKTGGGGSGKLIVILAVIGAAAAGGAYFATRKGSTTSTVVPPPVNPIGLTPGTGTIVAGH